MSAEIVPEDRLRDLEVAEEKRADRGRLDHHFELFEAIILSIAAVLAAWTGFQAAKWSGVQANSYSQAGASRVESTRASTRAGQETTVDVIAFTQWLQAAEAEGLLTRQADPNAVYVPDPNVLSGFLYERFRPEFKPAVDAWIATRPRTNASAPPTPFAMPEYKVAAAAEAARLEQRAEEQSAAARQANQRSDNYVLALVLFASALFFAGISTKLNLYQFRVAIVAMGYAVFLGTLIWLATFPITVAI